MGERATAWRVRAEGWNAGRFVALHSIGCEVRERSVKFDERVAGFAHNAQLPRDEVRLSADDAITQFVNGRLADIDRLRGQIARAEMEIDAARMLTVAEPIARVDD
jgi:hypothetical protein